MKKNGALQEIRSQQNLNWMDTLINEAEISIQGLKERIGAIRCRRSGDEFYLLLKGPDAEGTKAYLEARLIPYIENELPKLIREQAEEDLGEFDTTFEDAGNKISSGIGITSTQLSQGSDFYRRLAKYIKT